MSGFPAKGHLPRVSLLSMQPWTAATKKALSQCCGATNSCPGQRPLAPSVASVTSVANDKGNNEIIPGAGTDLLALALQLRKTPEKSARRPSDEGALRPVIASNGIPLLQMKSVGSHSTAGREMEGKKERTGQYPQQFKSKPLDCKTRGYVAESVERIF